MVLYVGIFFFSLRKFCISFEVYEVYIFIYDLLILSLHYLVYQNIVVFNFKDYMTYGAKSVGWFYKQVNAHLIVRYWAPHES